MLLKRMARIFCDLTSEGILSEVIILYICVIQAAVLEIHKSELLHKGIVSDMGRAVSSHCRRYDILLCVLWFRQVHEGWYQDAGAASEIKVKWKKPFSHH